MKQRLQRYMDLRKQLEIMEDENYSLMLEDAQKAQDSYWEAERRLHKKYGYDYAVTCYDFKIPMPRLGPFELCNIGDDHYILECSARDNDGEKFIWILKIPFDMEKLPDFIKEFETKQEQATLLKIQKKEQEKLEKDKREFERLKERFG